jgi:DNA repair protein RecN (Recombination protein N)
VLTELHIENLGVIERAVLALDAGMTALTGETGAGKTMLVEAIDLLVGGRADAAVVRTGANEARVDGRDAAMVEEGDAVACTAGRWPARLVTFTRRDFHRVLRAKFGLSDR